MKKITTLILLIISFLTRVNAQEQLNKKQLADNLFERYEYFKSVSIYLELAGKDGSRYYAVERVADCYRLMNDYENAEIWYQRAVAFGEAAAIDHYYYAETLLRNKKFKEARDEYKTYYALENTDQLPFKLAVCDSAQKWMKSPQENFTVTNAQKYNSKYSDWGLTNTAKSGFVFTSDRINDKQKKDVYNRTGDGYFNLYQTNGDAVTPLVLKTKGNAIFNNNYHIGPMVLTGSGDTAYITITTTVPAKKLLLDSKSENSTQRLYTRRLQLIMATKIKGQWASFKNFPFNNLNEYSVGNAALSKNGNVIYFTSDMPGGEGKTDIWYCVKQSNGDWDAPVNCGKSINTKEDESFPNTSGDSTLYFSSNGLPGMGGLDIFKARGQKANWHKPINLKFPVNSTSDDFYFTTADSLSGYFSSNREDGKGNDDIYSFGYKPPPAVIKIPVKPTPIIVASVPIPTPQAATAILTLKKGEGIILNNIYYDVDKSNIRPDAANELSKLAAVLREHPSIRIEVGSHTDSRAPSRYNLGLSNRRAASAVAYLVKHGVARYRLVAKGYGDTQLLNQCVKGEYCTEADHQVNRRTEIHILSE